MGSQRPIVQIADAETNTIFSDLPGVLKIKVSRSGYSQPGSAEITVASHTVADGQGTFVPPSSTQAAKSVSFGPGQDMAYQFAHDGRYAYVAIQGGTNHGYIAKVDMHAGTGDAPTVVSTLTLTSGEWPVRTISIDGNNQYGYVATFDSPARIIKFDLSSMSRVNQADLDPLDGYPSFLIASSAGTQLYVATDRKLMQFNISGTGISWTGSLLLDDAWGRITGMRGIGQYIYSVGNDPEDQVAVVAKFHGEDYFTSPEYVSHTKLGSTDLHGFAIDLDTNGNGYISTAYTGSPPQIITLDITGTSPRKTGSLTLPAAYGPVFTIDWDPGSNYLYAVQSGAGYMRLLKLSVVGEAPVLASTLSLPAGLTNGYWLQVSGSSAYISTLQSPAAFVKVDLQSVGSEPAPSGSYSRFYPYLQIRVIEEGGSSPRRQYFRGRIDQAKLREDDQYGRVWVIQARDWLSVLADNYVDKGSWFRAVLPAVRKTQTGDPAAPNGIMDGQPYVPTYTKDYGEYRRIMISDLCLNVVHNDKSGLLGVEFTGAANSKPVQKDFSKIGQIAVIDAIRDLARSDPWATASLGHSEVDARDLERLGFPDGSGIGGELQVICNTEQDDARTVEYFMRGELDSGQKLSYGNKRRDPTVTGYIISYNFDHDGSDIFSRTRVTGKGEAQTSTDAVGGGEGISVEDMENLWAPNTGLFRVRREVPNRSQGIVGEWIYSEQTDESSAISARDQRDSAYANLLSGAPGLESERGGFVRGYVTVGGPPNGPGQTVVKPGTQLTLILEHLNITDAKKYTLESWQYEWPAHQTVYNISRVAYSDMGQQLLKLIRQGGDSASAHNNFYDSGWTKVDSGGHPKFNHALGVKPGNLSVEAAQWDGNTMDANNHPLPIKGTTVSVPHAAWDPAQGQNSGWFPLKVDAQDVQIGLSHWVAYSDGAGQWLSLDDSNTLIRLRAYP